MSTAAIANVSDVSFAWTSPNLRINWTGTGDSYEVRYHTDDGDFGEPVVSTDNTGITIGGLTPGSHYDFEVVTLVDSDKVGDTVTLPDYYGYVIPQNLTAPTGCKMISESATQCTVQFKAPNGTWDFIINWMDEEDNLFQDTITTNDNSPEYTIENMDPDKNYRIWFSITKNDEVVDSDCYLDKEKACCD